MKFKMANNNKQSSPDIQDQPQYKSPAVDIEVEADLWDFDLQEVADYLRFLNYEVVEPEVELSTEDFNKKAKEERYSTPTATESSEVGLDEFSEEDIVGYLEQQGYEVKERPLRLAWKEGQKRAICQALEAELDLSILEDFARSHKITYQFV